MSSGSQNDCPLCMEPFELDDTTFFPCTCGYQICRFCWHRIRTDENGLCPACRRSYTESPAVFKPLADTDLQKLKKEKRQKESQKKQKAAESRSQLASVRVVQKNLVFVVGLSQRLADPEILRRSEYFGRFGKIHKIVINTTTSYAGVQGPSASAYVTFYRSEDAIRAIQAINNITVDGRTVKASLGTTKYCTFFLRGLSCTKTDCMYLHELGDELGSFTKEQMQQGKHLEYEQALYDESNPVVHGTTASVPLSSSHHQSPHNHHVKLHPSTSAISGQKRIPSSARHQNSRHSHSVQSTKSGSTRRVKESREDHQVAAEDSLLQSELQSKASATDKRSQCDENSHPDPVASCRNSSSLINATASSSLSDAEARLTQSQTGSTASKVTAPFPMLHAVNTIDAEGSGQQRSCREITSTVFQADLGDTLEEVGAPNRLTSDLTQQPGKSDSHDDDLEFDPWNESTKGLADMMEKENKFFDNRLTHVDQFNNHVERQNRAFAQKQLLITSQNGQFSPTHVWPPTGSTSALEYQIWQNNMRLLHTKPKPSCDVVQTPTNGHLIPGSNDFPLRAYQNCGSISEKERNFLPGDCRWAPSMSIGPDCDVPCAVPPHWHSLLQPISRNFVGFRSDLKMRFGVPFGVISNLRPDVRPAPPGFYSMPSIPAHVESQGTLADSVD